MTFLQTEMNQDEVRKKKDKKKRSTDHDEYRKISSLKYFWYSLHCFLYTYTIITFNM